MTARVSMDWKEHGCAFRVCSIVAKFAGESETGRIQRRWGEQPEGTIHTSMLLPTAAPV